ncbi:hypothetical protein B0H10DRAFT_2160694 [Mycena sp. CBHHK59/15]|nr:hypothetical protein B0H10DRAFT_2160694 [Mycena sp. CBHHK59/15]
MNSPVSLDRGPVSTPPRLPSRGRTATVSPRKEDPYLDDDDGYETDKSFTDGFTIRDQLVAPRAEVESDCLIHEGSIDLNPPYQRDVVWPLQKQINLIDSLFRNFWIPPVVFAVQLDEDNMPYRVCVDGKQRLTSIQRFLDGQIPHKDIRTKKCYYYTTPESSKNIRLQIPDSAKEIFAQKQVTCVEYTDLTPAMEREIFQRVQLGMTLTTAEKLAAIDSPWAEWISHLESRHVSIEGGLSQVLDWDTKRGREFQNVAQFVYCCDTEKVPTAPKMESWLSRADKPGAQFKIDIDNALCEFGHIATDRELNMAFTIGKKLAPVEFVFIGVLLYVLRKSTSKERAHAVYHLRKGIRAQFTDVRMNSSVGAALWALINHLKHNPMSSVLGDSQSASKKKRKTADDDSDGEYRPTPIKSLSKNPQTRSRRR